MTFCHLHAIGAKYIIVDDVGSGRRQIVTNDNGDTTDAMDGHANYDDSGNGDANGDD